MPAGSTLREPLNRSLLKIIATEDWARVKARHLEVGDERVHAARQKPRDGCQVGRHPLVIRADPGAGPPADASGRKRAGKCR